jgi:RNA polymerase sigma-70 factor, ECF subfamily
VAQEAFVKAYTRLDRFRGDSPFRPWLLAIVANEARNLQRSRRRREALATRFAARADPVDTSADQPAETAVAEERRAALLGALRAMDDRDREVLACRYLLDLSEAETAQALGWRLGTVKSRSARALAKLRTRLAAGHASEVPHG